MPLAWLWDDASQVVGTALNPRNVCSLLNPKKPTGGCMPFTERIENRGRVIGWCDAMRCAALQCGIGFVGRTELHLLSQTSIDQSILFHDPAFAALSISFEGEDIRNLNQRIRRRKRGEREREREGIASNLSFISTRRPVAEFHT
jgi:hypothetical protein